MPAQPISRGLLSHVIAGVQATPLLFTINSDIRIRCVAARRIKALFCLGLGGNWRDVILSWRKQAKPLIELLFEVSCVKCTRNVRTLSELPRGAKLGSVSIAGGSVSIGRFQGSRLRLRWMRFSMGFQSDF